MLTGDNRRTAEALGADVAIEAADVAIMGQDLTHLPAVLAHARRARRIMRQNLALSAAILVVLVPLAATGVLGLATVVAAHELAEVVVIANGVRAGRNRGVAATATAPVTGAQSGGACEDECCGGQQAEQAPTASVTGGFA